MERKRIREAQLHVERALVADSFGALSVLAEQNRWSDLVRKHNDKDDPYHLQLLEFCVIGHEFDPAHDIVRINFSSLWMILNALRAINAQR